MSKNNYRERIIRLEAQLEQAIAHLNQFDSNTNWASQLAEIEITPEHYQAKLKEFQARARANLKPGLGRKPAKPVVIGNRETTYKQEAQRTGVSVSAIYNRIKRQKEKTNDKR